MNKKDFLLSALKITNWQLKRPELLQGYNKLNLNSNIQLLFISENNHSDNFFFSDVLQILNLKPDQTLWLKPSELTQISLNHKISVICLAKVEIPDALLMITDNIWQGNLENLLKDPITKKQLWHSIEPWRNY